MKKLLFLIPLALLILNATPWALYKNTINYTLGHPYSLSPAYWRQLSLKQAPHSIQFQSTVIVDVSGTLPSAIPLSKDARFYGFPVGFYLKKANILNDSLPGVPFTVTAFSWLWATVDGAIVIVTLLAALWFNRRRRFSQTLTTNKTQSTS
jgi:hypothetical protein